MYSLSSTVLYIHFSTKPLSRRGNKKTLQDRHVERLLTRNKLERGREGSKNTGFKQSIKRNNHRTGK